MSLYAFDNGMDWVAGVVDKKNAGFYPSLTLDPSGVAYGTYSTAQKKDKSKAKWVRIALPDLTGTWDGMTVTEDGGARNVNGTLSIRNNGLEKAVKSSVRLHVGDEEEFDEAERSGRFCSA